MTFNNFPKPHPGFRPRSRVGGLGGVQLGLGGWVQTPNANPEPHTKRGLNGHGLSRIYDNPDNSKFAIIVHITFAIVHSDQGFKMCTHRPPRFMLDLRKVTCGPVWARTASYSINSFAARFSCFGDQIVSDISSEILQTVGIGQEVKKSDRFVSPEPRSDSHVESLDINDPVR